MERPACAQSKPTTYELEDGPLKSRIGKPFPTFSFPGSLGRLYTNKDFAGKTTLVDIWELGCTPCMFSIKYLNAIHDSLQARGFQLFSMVRNDWQDCIRALDRNRERRQYMLPQYEVMSMGSGRQSPQNQTTVRQLNSMGWPFFLVVDSKGIVLDVYSGFDLPGNDVHAESPAKTAYSNATVQWVWAALERARVTASIH